MTGPSDLYKFKALMIPWSVRGIDDVMAALTKQPPESSWHDGDTFNALVSKGMRGYEIIHIRTAGDNAPEVKTGKPGAAATTFARSLADTGSIVYLDSLAFAAADEEDDFGRMLAKVTLPDGRNLADVMIAAGQAVADPA